MPEKIGELTDLQTLATFNIGNNPSYSTIRELENLNSLTGALEITGFDNIKDPDEAKKFNLENKNKLESLSLEWSSGRQYTQNEICQVESAEKVLESLRPSENLKELIMRSYPGRHFPAICSRGASFRGLDSVILDGCFNCKEFPDLSQLPFLRCLSIRKMSHVQKLVTSKFTRIPNKKKTPKQPTKLLKPHTKNITDKSQQTKKEN
ncbi:hypothetical protein LUZ60_012822 [Juncus effusus]|nr:hypothetical protein LUZ60_012822 [Juncus effusus]